MVGGSLNGLVDFLRKKLCSMDKVSKLRLVVLFGSYARGDYTEESDIDVLVVADDLPRDPREAFEKLVIMEEPRITPIGLNTEIFLKKLERGEPFILEIIEDGKIVCYDEEFLERIMRIYREKRKHYKRVGDLWIMIK